MSVSNRFRNFQKDNSVIMAVELYLTLYYLIKVLTNVDLQL